VTGNRKKKTLSTIEVARMLGVAVSSISKWIDQGKLEAGKTPGGHRRIERENLIHFLRSHKLRIPDELQHSAGARILLVDDEQAVVDWLTEAIKEKFPSAKISQANDGYSAGEMVGQVKPDLIILDLFMPGMDGFEVCRRIKANPASSRTKIIAMTGHLSPEIQKDILHAGASICLEKPTDTGILMGEIAKAIAHFQ
jgi:excisionase family DNA binding protein